VWQDCTRNEWTLSTPEMVMNIGVIGPFEEGYLREAVGDRTFNLDVKAIKDQDTLQALPTTDCVVTAHSSITYTTYCAHCSPPTTHSLPLYYSRCRGSSTATRTASSFSTPSSTRSHPSSPRRWCRSGRTATCRR
jgi:hypothetical protein